MLCSIEEYQFILLQYNLHTVLSMQQPQNIVFIRHGQSQKNAAVHKFRTQRNLPQDWALLHKDPLFEPTVTHNPDLIDCHLSPQGIKQCQQTRQLLKDLQPDLIICSPLQRALQTTRIVFPDRKCPRIVEPWLSQTFKHSSEVCRSIDLKKQEFNEFDFSKVEAEGEFWFIKNDSYENQKKYFQFLKEIHFEGITYRHQAEKITEFMNSSKLRETATNVRERARKVKQLLEEYSKKYETIAVVTHFYTIKFLNATEFNEMDEPVNKVHMTNCGILKTSLAELNKIN